MKRRAPVTAAAVLTILFASSASADTITFNDSFAATSLDSLGSVTLQQFDSSLGLLDSLMITFDGTLSGEVVDWRYNQGPGTIVTFGSLTRTMGLDLTGPLTSDLVMSADQTWSSTLVRPDHGVRHSNTHTFTSTQSLNITDAAALAYFTGLDSLTFDLFGGMTLNYLTTHSQVDTTYTGFGSGTVRIDYFYSPFALGTPPGDPGGPIGGPSDPLGDSSGDPEPQTVDVPEPTMLALFGLGMAGGVWRRYRRS